MVIKDVVDVIKLRVMRWEDYIGLFEWVLDIIIGFFREGDRGRLDIRRREGGVIIEIGVTWV